MVQKTTKNEQPDAEHLETWLKLNKAIPALLLPAPVALHTYREC